MVRLRAALGLFSLLILAAFGLWASNYFTHNVHAVLPHQVYRSAQLTHDDLAHLVQRYGIRSVINLRGANPDIAWYQDEIAVAQERQLWHADLALDAHHLPDVATLTQLVNLIEQAPKPLLLHCRQGADRTGLASAIALALLNQQSSESLLWRQVGWRYNVVSPTSVGYQFMVDFTRWCHVNHQSVTGENLKRWLASTPALPAQWGWAA
jgi:undecaprenyl-diphosphatase